MKRKLYLVILLFAMALCCMAQNIGEAFYIYRNDGKANAFFRDDVLSIEYSYEDLEGNTYDEIVTQIVNTKDSIYKIPLAVIDSVGFVQPETILKTDVIDMALELRKYVISATSTSMEISASIPLELLPKKGEKIVYLIMDDTFPAGFAGIISNVTQNIVGNYILSFDDVQLEDIFDQYYCPFSATSEYDNSSSAPIRSRRVGGGGDFSFKVPPFKLQMNDWFNLANDDDFAFSYTKDIGISVTPSFRLMGFVIVDKELGTSINTTIIGDYNIKEWMKISGKGAFSKDVKVLHVEEPIAPLVTVFLDGGFFAKFEGSITSDFSAHQNFRSIFNVSYDSKAVSQRTPILNFSPTENEIDDDKITADITTSVGTFTEIGLSFVNSALDKLSGRVEGGIAFNVKGTVYKRDLQNADKSSDFYKKLTSTDTPISIYPNYNFSVGANIASWNVSKDLFNIDCPPFFEGKHVPNFSDVTIEQGNGTTITASANLSGFCIRPVKVGFMLVDENGSIVESKLYHKTYYNSNSFSSYSIDFDNIQLNKDYTIYPVVEVFDRQIRALPEADAGIKIDVITGNSANITTTSATLYGEIQSFEINGYEHGICYGLLENKDSWNYQSINDVFSNYSIELTSLSSSTTYYYAAYIKVDDIYYYGDVLSFTTASPIVVTTGEATDVTETSATLTGYVSGADLENRDGTIYFYYNTIGNPSASNSIVCEVGKLKDFPSGVFSLTLSSLQPNTIYYCKASVILNGENCSGEIISFKTKEKTSISPHVTTGDVINVSGTTATLSGYLEKELIYERYGVRYTEQGREQWISIDANEQTEGFFTVVASDLSKNTVYTYQAFCIINGDTQFGEQKTFRTEDLSVSLYIDALPGGRNVELVGSLNLYGNVRLEEIEYGFCVSSTENSSDWRYIPCKTIGINESINSDGTFYISGNYRTIVDGLSPNSKYYCKSYVKKGTSYIYSNDMSFKTGCDITVTTISPSCIMWNSAIVGGIIEGQIEGSLTYQSYSIQYAKSSEQFKTMDFRGIGADADNNEFTVLINELDENTTYYYRVFYQYEIYNDQTYSYEFYSYYGDIKSFTTKCKTVKITTSDVTCNNDMSADITIILQGLTECDIVKEVGVCLLTTEGSEKDYQDLYYDQINNHKERFLAELNTNGSGNVHIGEWLEELQQYWYRAFVVTNNEIIWSDEKNFTTTIAKPEPIDLGLSVMWASCDLGAPYSKPYKQGKRYYWGHTEVADYRGFSQVVPFTMNIWGTEYDAAHVLLKDNWRMPTKEEWQELREKCVLELITGGLAAVKYTGPNGNSIIMPIPWGYFDENGQEVLWTGSGQMMKGDYWNGTGFDPNEATNGALKHSRYIRPVYIKEQ